MNLEGNLLGYRKKTLALAALLLVVAGVMFYAGAKYEKRKLTALKSVKTTTAVSAKVKKQGDTATVTPKTSTPGATSQNQNTTNPSDATTQGVSGDTTSNDLQN